jgi:hypothetical protein
MGLVSCTPRLSLASRHEEADQVRDAPAEATLPPRLRLPWNFLQPPLEIGVTTQVADAILGQHERVMGSVVDHIHGPFVARTCEPFLRKHGSIVVVGRSSS